MSSIITPKQSITQAILLAACKRAGEQLERDELPQPPAQIGIDTCCRLSGVVTLGRPTFGRSQVEWRRILSQMVVLADAIQPERGRRILRDIIDSRLWKIAQPEELALIDTICELARGEAIPRAGAIGGQVDAELL